MVYIAIIVTRLITQIRMALKIEPVPPTIMDIDILYCIITITVEGHMQDNVLIIFIILIVTKMVRFFYFSFVIPCPVYCFL